MTTAQKRTGSFNRKITIETNTPVQSDSGDPVANWQTTAIAWAAAEPDRGREFFAGAGIVAAKPMLFRMHYRPGLTVLNRIVYQGDVYNIDSIQDYKDAREETRVYARSGVNEG